MMNPYIETRWLWNKFRYKFRMYRKFNRYMIMHWECTEAIFFIPMEIFKDFYEKCVISPKSVVDWSYHEIELKKMKDIYNYYSILRPSYIILSDICMDNYHDCKIGMFPWNSTYKEGRKEEAKTWISRAIAYDNLVVDKDKFYLKELADVHLYMWE